MNSCAAEARPADRRFAPPSGAAGTADRVGPAPAAALALALTLAAVTTLIGPGLTPAQAQAQAATSLALALAPPAGNRSGPDSRSREASVDRAFGHVIGDVARVEDVIAVPPGFSVASESWPAPGPVNAWLRLLSIQVERLAGPGPDSHFRLTRRYQFTASADQVKLLDLPAVELRLLGPRTGGDEGKAKGDGDADGPRAAEPLLRLLRLDARPVTVSPLTGRASIARRGFGDWQADRLLPDPGPRLARLDHWLTIALVTLAAALAAVVLLRRRPGAAGPLAPFRRVARDLARLDRQARFGPVDVEAAYRAMHRGFDQIAGQTVLASDLDTLARQHRAIADRRGAIAAFYARSGAHFFGGAASPPPRDEIRALRDLARALAASR